jgi:hypothetical protein
MICTSGTTYYAALQAFMVAVLEKTMEVFEDQKHMISMAVAPIVLE